VIKFHVVFLSLEEVILTEYCLKIIEITMFVGSITEF
jgi:hypothetical protein